MMPNLAATNLPLTHQGKSEIGTNGIIGDSPALQSVLAEVERVAPTDSTVLVLGETGTGKELIARAIHNLSPRSHRPFVSLNSAAIPAELLESELFGHEKGAFTGAIAPRIGRFEMADAGTLFLDEIGDIPLALQPKLLRVLQEQEFERVGSGTTQRINVRLVAATHRDLTQMVSQREFRMDSTIASMCFRRAAAAAGTAAGHSTIGLPFCRAFFSSHGQANQSYTAGHSGGIYLVFLAGQRAGTTEPDRTSRDSRRQRSASESAG